MHFFSLSRQTKFFTFPETLIVHAKKFQLLNWVPTKLDIPVILPVGDVLEFTEKHVGKGLQPGEQELGEARTYVPLLFPTLFSFSLFDCLLIFFMCSITAPAIRC